MEAIFANIQNALISQSYDIAKALGFALRPFLPIFKLVSFLEY